MSDRRRNMLWCFGLGCVLAAVLLARPATASDGDSSEGGSLQMPDLEAPADAPAPFRFGVGTLTAGRRMVMQGGTDAIRHRPGTFFGLQLGASGTLLHLEDLEAQLRADADFGYGITRSIGAPATAGRTLVSELVFGGVRVLLMRQVANRLHLGLGAGLQATSIVLEPNHVYTGHRYISAEAPLRLQWRAMPGRLTLIGEAAAYPVFSNENSRGAHGPGRSFGGRAEAEIVWRIDPTAPRPALRAFRLVGAYRYQRFRTQFPQSPLGRSGAVSIDNQHVAGVYLEYAIPAQ